MELRELLRIAPRIVLSSLPDSAYSISTPETPSWDPYCFDYLGGRIEAPEVPEATSPRIAKL